MKELIAGPTRFALVGVLLWCALGATGAPASAAAGVRPLIRSVPDPVMSAPAPLPRLTVRVFARTGLHLGGILWTGTQFLYPSESGRSIEAGDGGGRRLHVLTTVPTNSGEMRCILSPATHGFPTGGYFCHASGNQIYQISGDGRHVTLFAQLPGKQGSDGALTYDSGGAFGFKLLGATGGSDAGSGGAVYTIGADRSVARIGGYGGPGGAENAMMAPPGFGQAAGDLLLAIDKHDHLGRLLAMDPAGKTYTLVRGLTYGLNPLAVIGASTNRAGVVSPGLYIADWYSHNVLFIPGAELKPYAAALFVATERRGQLYVVLPAVAGDYRLSSLATDLHQPDYNFEGAVYVGG